MIVLRYTSHTHARTIRQRLLSSSEDSGNAAAVERTRAAEGR